MYVIKFLYLITFFNSFLLGISLDEYRPPEINKNILKEDISERLSQPALALPREQKVKQIDEKALKSDILNSLKIQIGEVNATMRERMESQKRAKEYKEEFDRFFNPFLYEDQVEILKNIRSNSLYSTINSKNLSKFGINFFKNSSNFEQKFQSRALPKNYIISVDDVITINTFGFQNFNYELQVSKDGFITIPRIGVMKVAGLTIELAKEIIEDRLESTYQNTKAKVLIQNASVVSVSVVGEVKYPGNINLVALSRVKDALMLVGGIKSTGSLRNIQIERDKEIVATLDIYDLIFNQSSKDDILLKSGDTIFVPKSNRDIHLVGEVKEEAIYELKEQESLDTLLKYAGGLKSRGKRDGIKIKRVINNRDLTLIDAKDLTKLRDGDVVIVPRVDDFVKNRVTLYGNVVRTGDRFIDRKETLYTLFTKEIREVGSLNRVFLKNTLFEYVLIKRVDRESLESKIISANLKKILNGDRGEDVKLFSSDEIYIFNKEMIDSSRYVTIKGKVLRAGKYRYFESMKLGDLINIAGVSEVADLEHIKVISEFDSKKVVNFYNSTELNKIELKPFDVIDIRQKIFKPIERVKISGAVYLEGSFEYSKGMTLSDLISLSGGLKSKEIEYIKVISIDSNQRVVNIYDLAQAKRIALLPKDIVYIKARLVEPTKRVKISGAVENPGEYDYFKGIDIAKLISLAGGFKASAYQREFELTRYTTTEDGDRDFYTERLRLDRTIDLKFRLKPFDEVKIFTDPNIDNKIMATISGEVKFPGTYTLKKGSRLSDLIERAGGFSESAFIDGAIFKRAEIAILQKNILKKQLEEIESKVYFLDKNRDELNDKSYLLKLFDKLKLSLKERNLDGRITLHLDKNLEKFKESEYNLILKNRDTLEVPVVDDSILIAGEVLNPTAVIYREDKDIDYYIDLAGGLKKVASKDEVLLIYPNGESRRISSEYSSIFDIFKSNRYDIKRGSKIVVPPNFFTSYEDSEIAKDLIDIFYKVALSFSSLNLIFDN